MKSGSMKLYPFEETENGELGTQTFTFYFIFVNTFETFFIELFYLIRMVESAFLKIELE